MDLWVPRLARSSATQRRGEWRGLRQTPEQLSPPQRPAPGSGAPAPLDDARCTAAGASWSEVPALVVNSRQVRVAGIARSEPVCLDRGTVRSPALLASLSVDCRGDPARSAIARQLASPARGPVVFGMRHGRQAFSSLCRVRAGGRGQKPPRRQSTGDASTKAVANDLGISGSSFVDSRGRNRLRRWGPGTIFDRASSDPTLVVS